MASKTPEAELVEFLASLPSWVQKMIQLEDDNSFSDKERSALAKSGHWWTNTRPQLVSEYERILQRDPAKWREYRKKWESIFQMGVPKGRPGAPKKESSTAKMSRLKQEKGMNAHQIATTLSKELPKPISADAVRKRLERQSKKE